MPSSSPPSTNFLSSCTNQSRDHNTSDISADALYLGLSQQEGRAVFSGDCSMESNDLVVLGHAHVTTGSDVAQTTGQTPAHVGLSPPDGNERERVSILNAMKSQGLNSLGSNVLQLPQRPSVRHDVASLVHDSTAKKQNKINNNLTRSMTSLVTWHSLDVLLLIATRHSQTLVAVQHTQHVATEHIRCSR